MSNTLTFKTNSVLNNQTSIELINNQKINSVDFKVSDKLNLNNYISPYLKYKNLQPCCLIQKNQFIDAYTILGYLEAITVNSLEIVKLKVKKKESKQILLISNTDCLTLQKSQFVMQLIGQIRATWPLTSPAYCILSIFLKIWFFENYIVEDF